VRPERSDVAEALARIRQRHAGDRAQKLVAAETDDEVVGAQMRVDQRDDAFEQLVAGAVALAVVEGW